MAPSLQQRPTSPELKKEHLDGLGWLLTLLRVWRAGEETPVKAPLGGRCSGPGWAEGLGLCALYMLDRPPPPLLSCSQHPCREEHSCGSLYAQAFQMPPTYDRHKLLTRNHPGGIGTPRPQQLRGKSFLQEPWSLRGLLFHQTHLQSPTLHTK